MKSPGDCCRNACVALTVVVGPYYGKVDLMPDSALTALVVQSLFATT